MEARVSLMRHFLQEVAHTCVSAYLVSMATFVKLMPVGASQTPVTLANVLET
ncbi:hypothetical protein LEMLEM_LOCUS11397 [Lemmus lemmus]